MKKRIAPIILSTFLFLLIPQISFAQDLNKISLAITPPLVKNNVNPGQTWNSSVKLVNNNPIEIEAYVELRDFTTGAEAGTVVFLNDNTQAENSFLLSSWITIAEETIVIPPFGSKEIPYSIKVPADAEPGGHYAAILAGTKPPKRESGGSSIKVSSLLASLILLNVKGEVVEQGMVREFSTDKTVYSEPNVNFSVRFENTGNVHFQPQGEIRITNFFNRDVGNIRINHNTDFGNILPKSIRKWEYNWQADDSLLATGRYKAVLSLGYGEIERKSANSTVFFWVINWKLIITIAGLVFFVIMLALWMIRLYIRRAIINTQKMAGIVMPQKDKQKHKILVVPEENGEVSRAKVTSRIKTKTAPKNRKKNIRWSSLKLAIIIVIAVFLALLVYIWWQEKNSSSLVPSPANQDKEKMIQDKAEPKDVPPFEISDTKATQTTDRLAVGSSTDPDLATQADEKAPTSTAEDNNETVDNEVKAPELEKGRFNVTILNGTGQSGVAGRAAELLTADGFNIIRTGNADNYNYFNTLIQYSENSFEAASYISRFLPIEPEMEEVDGEDSVVVIIGRDFK